MLGTLNGALEVRGISLDSDAIRADTTGMMEVRDGIPVLSRIDVHYRLAIPQGSREKVDRALGRHQDKCPTAQSLRGAVAVQWEADIEEG